MQAQAEASIDELITVFPGLLEATYRALWKRPRIGVVVSRIVDFICDNPRAREIDIPLWFTAVVHERKAITIADLDEIIAQEDEEDEEEGELVSFIDDLQEEIRQLIQVEFV